MTVILVLSTFLVFIVVDYVLSRKKAIQPRVAPEVSVAAVANPAYVEGFLVPETLRYHAGHSWAMRERKHLFRVGLDEFGAALMGRIDKIELPKPGVWIRQGQKAFSFYRGGEKTDVLSPTEGEVVELNTDLLNDPSALRKDPYGAGWLMMVHVPDEETVDRNLVPKNMVTSWMRDAVERLYGRQPQLAGAVAADGGRPAEDVFAALSGVSWPDLTGEFFLTK